MTAPTSAKAPDSLVLLKPEVLADLETKAKKDHAAGLRETASTTTEEAEQAKTSPDNVITYLIKVASDIDQAKYRRTMKAAGARMWQKADMIAAAREEITGIVPPPENLADLLAACDRFELLNDETPKDKASEIVEEWTALSRALSNGGGPFAGLVAENEFWLEMAPLTAMRCFLLGTTEQRFRRGADGLLQDADVATVSPLNRILIGYRALALFSPSEAEAKNSASPQPLPSSQKNTTAANSQSTALNGSSSEKATSETLN